MKISSRDRQLKALGTLSLLGTCWHFLTIFRLLHSMPQNNFDLLELSELFIRKTLQSFLYFFQIDHFQFFWCNTASHSGQIHFHESHFSRRFLEIIQQAILYPVPSSNYFTFSISGHVCFFPCNWVYLDFPCWCFIIALFCSQPLFMLRLVQMPKELNLCYFISLIKLCSSWFLIPHNQIILAGLILVLTIRLLTDCGFVISS